MRQIKIAGHWQGNQIKDVNAIYVIHRNTRTYGQGHALLTRHDHIINPAAGGIRWTPRLEQAGERRDGATQAMSRFFVQI